MPNLVLSPAVGKPLICRSAHPTEGPKNAFIFNKVPVYVSLAAHFVEDCFINISQSNVTCKDAVFEEWSS